MSDQRSWGQIVTDALHEHRQKIEAMQERIAKLEAEVQRLEQAKAPRKPIFR